ncbi:MAG TPA: phosphoribosylformylglycinamidine synthase subunit PurS [Edaphocola sp.]|nr:phosphoribosylformylglycinamidine synthase subunit PurS [Edaphocola sp.]
MKYTAQIKIMPLKELLDPQGKAVAGGLSNLGITQVDDIRIGKHIALSLIADSESQAKNIVEEACQKLLANMVMESYEYEIVPA